MHTYTKHGNEGKLHGKKLIPLFLVVTGLVLHFTKIADWRQLLEYVEMFSHNWWVLI